MTRPGSDVRPPAGMFVSTGQTVCSSNYKQTQQQAGSPRWPASSESAPRPQIFLLVCHGTALLCGLGSSLNVGSFPDLEFFVEQQKCVIRPHERRNDNNNVQIRACSRRDDPSLTRRDAELRDCKSDGSESPGRTGDVPVGTTGGEASRRMEDAGLTSVLHIAASLHI